MEGVCAAGVVFNRNLVVLEIVNVHGDELFVPGEFVCMELGDVEFFLCAMEIVGVVAVMLTASMMSISPQAGQET